MKCNQEIICMWRKVFNIFVRVGTDRYFTGHLTTSTNKLFVENYYKFHKVTHAIPRNKLPRIPMIISVLEGEKKCRKCNKKGQLGKIWVPTSLQIESSRKQSVWHPPYFLASYFMLSPGAGIQLVISNFTNAT